ncbi:retrovirus-related pol polyprotein from transposon TNT 1-94 [Tanacetum coccineum]
MNFVEKFIGSVRFGNDHLGAIMGYGDYVMGDSVISRVYYVEGLGHNLFSVGQFCDSDLEVAFRKHTCFVRDINGTDILKGSRSTNLYTISMDEMMKSSPICLLSKASKSTRLKFEQGIIYTRLSTWKKKSKKFSHRPKSENTNIEVLHTLHMDLCGPMRVQSIKGKKYILVIVDDYSRFTWVKFLRSKDETPEFVTNFLKQIQLVHDKKPDLTFFRVFGALCYPTNDSENLGKFQAKADIGIFVGAAPTDKELEMLFQPMFDEHLEQYRGNEPVPSATEITAYVVPPDYSIRESSQSGAARQIDLPSRRATLIL